MDLQKHDTDKPHITSFSSHGENPRQKTAAQMVQHKEAVESVRNRLVRR
jgi:hypothetical protein